MNDTSATLAGDALDAAIAGNVRGMIEALNTFYRIFNYTDYQGYKEQIVKLLFKAFFAFMRCDVLTEVPAGDGRIDAILKVPGHNYIIEFKVDSKSSDAAMSQMEEKRYADLFTLNDTPLHLVGIDFRTDKKRIDTYTYQLYGTDKSETIPLN